ncbi:hypothetical protein QE152_g14294 [Popillia japonica]|uniref:Uncharacterized protein n=1 Tax=Popillia japonica TaxID=7064 RepID=A0AAW1LBB5_POPJA
MPTSTVIKILPSTSTQSEFPSILKQFSPLPSCGEKRLKSQKRKAAKSDVLTSTPVKNMLIEKKNAVQEKQAAKKIKRKIPFGQVESSTKTKNKENIKAMQMYHQVLSRIQVQHALSAAKVLTKTGSMQNL